MPFLDILAVIWRRKLTIIVCVVVAALAAAGYLGLHKPTYTASATVQVTVPTANGGGGASVADVPDPVVALSDPSVISDARRIAGGRLDGQVSGSVSPTTNVLTVVATAPSPSGAQLVANAYAKAYVDFVASSVTDQANKINLAMMSLNTTITQLERQDPAGTNPAILAQVNADSQTYATLAAERENILIGGSYASLQQPAGPGSPTGSSKSKIGGVAVGAGLLVGVGIVLVREQSDSSVRSEIDVAEVTGQPVLAELPVDDEGTGRVSVVDEPASLWAESVRELRTSLRVLLEDKPGALVMITSPAPGDGKSTVAANLAAAWAMVDRRVVLVSADFRRPRVEKLFGMEIGSRSGLAQLARFRGTAGPVPVPDGEEATGMPSRKDVTDRLVPSGVPGLVLMGSGGTPTNPSELLDGPALGVVLDHLADLADVVLLDVPPVLAVTDAAILGRLVTGVIVVVSEGQTSRHDLEATVNRLTATGSTMLGLVLNRARSSTGVGYRPYYDA